MGSIACLDIGIVVCTEDSTIVQTDDGTVLCTGDGSVVLTDSSSHKVDCNAPSRLRGREIYPCGARSRFDLFLDVHPGVAR